MSAQVGITEETSKSSPVKLDTSMENGLTDSTSSDKDSSVASKVPKLDDENEQDLEMPSVKGTVVNGDDSTAIGITIKEEDQSDTAEACKENNVGELQQPPKQETPTKVRELCKALKDDFKLEMNSAGMTPVTEDSQADKEDMKVEIRNANDVLMEAKSPQSKSPRKGQGQRQKARRRKKDEGKSPVKTERVAAKNKKQEEKLEQKNHLLTDYFPIRRSARVPASELKKMEQRRIEEAILSECVDGLEVEEFPLKGRGVVAEKPFKKGEFVVEYSGDLIDLDTAKQRDKYYMGKSDVGCYMYYFNHRNKAYCIDATAESGKLGRLLNHSKINPNCCTKVVDMDHRPYLIIIAVKDILSGEELLYDYGDRNKETLAANPWLAY